MKFTGFYGCELKKAIEEEDYIGVGLTSLILLLASPLWLPVYFLGWLVSLILKKQTKGK